jgi:superoxide dismutase
MPTTRWPRSACRETLEYHHDIHHKAYVDNGNKLIAGTEWEGKSLEEIVKGTYQAGAVAQNGIFNNASQHWNHNQFWEMMGPGETEDAGRAGEGADRSLRLGRQVQGGFRRRRRRPVRLGLVLAGQGQGRQRSRSPRPRTA